MDDLISRQAAIDVIKRHYRICDDLLEVIAYEDLLEVIAHEIEHLPSAQSEIIRCNSCKHDNNCAIQDIAQTGNKFFCGFAVQKGEQP